MSNSIPRILGDDRFRLLEKSAHVFPQGWNIVACFAVILLGRLAGQHADCAVRAEPPANPPEMVADAELNDVFFLDPDRGWAVGDRGAIWTTEDGGRSWRTQESPQACRWESVWFIDSKNGWIVGGWHHPGTLQSRGAVLRTRDGGQNWMPVPASTLPVLHQVQFRDDQRGWAIGDPTALYPAGVFQSDDGGRTWSPIAGSGAGSWLTGDFAAARETHATARGTSAAAPGGASMRLRRSSPRTGIVAGRDGRVGVVSDEGLLEVNVEAALGRHVRRLTTESGPGAWLVGDDGLVLRSSDAGLSWSPPAGAPPSGVAHADWWSVATYGAHVWLVGDPGSCVLHSADQGATWELLRTGQNLPLRSVSFLDANHGWATGALGTILATRDGGRSWKRLRGGGRVAVLGVFSDEMNLPLEMFAQVAGNDGYLSTVELPYRRDIESPDAHHASLESRMQAAVVAVGASGAHLGQRFPVRQRGLRSTSEQIVSGWDQVHGGQGFDRLVEYLVARLRVWRPEIVVTDDAAGESADPLAALTRQAVLIAAQKAGEPREFPEQIAQLGLNPWRVKKVFSYLGGVERGGVTLPATQLAPRWSRPLGDIAAQGRFLLSQQPPAAPATLGFRLVFNPDGVEPSRRDLLEGVSIPSGADGRRDVTTAPRGELTDLTRLVQKQRTLQQLMLRGGESGGAANAAWLAQMDGAVQGFGKQAAGELYWQMGQRFFETGQLELAAESWQHLATRLPHHDLTDAALVRLLELHSSAELNWRREKAARQQAVRSATAAAMPLGPIRTAAGEEAIQPARIVGQQATPTVVKPAVLATDVGVVGNQRPHAEKLAKILEQSRPALFAEPRLRLTWLAALRATGRAQDTEVLLRGAGRVRTSDPWSQAFSNEGWLTVPANAKSAAESAPRVMATSALGTTRPRLDGRLDDPLWSQASRCELRSELGDDAEWPATVWVARDREFLYLAATCRQAPGRAYEAPVTPRPRDATLSDRDRVEFHLDTDRDYATAFRLVCDERGWTHESCAGDVTWNPTWYVAAQQADGAWTIEAAIPWDELAAEPPAAGTIWALGLQRIVPGRGFQAWSRPAAVAAQPAGFGWIRFE